MTRTITILTSGTRGDVQPLIALGIGLRAAGHKVRIATHAEFKPLIDAYGLEFALVEGNPNDLLTLPAYRGTLTYNGELRHSIRASWRFLRAVRPHFERMLATAWQVSRSTDALIVTLPTTWGHQIAERLGVPCIWAPVQPLSRTGAFPSVFQPLRRSFGSHYNRLTHWVLEQGLWQPWRQSLNRWRRHTLGLPPMPQRRQRCDGAPARGGIRPADQGRRRCRPGRGADRTVHPRVTRGCSNVSYDGSRST